MNRAEWTESERWVISVNVTKEPLKFNRNFPVRGPFLSEVVAANSNDEFGFFWGLTSLIGLYSFYILTTTPCYYNSFDFYDIADQKTDILKAVFF